MRIGIDVTFLFDQYANRGIGTYGKELIRGLLIHKEHDWILFGYGTARANINELKTQDASNVRFVGLGNKRKSSIRNVFFFKFKFLPKIKRQKLDMFFACHSEQGLPIGICKTAVAVHDIIPIINNSYSTKNPLFNWIKGIFYRRNIASAKKADLIITISDFSKNELVKAGFDKAKIVRTYLGNKDIFCKANINDSQRDIRRTLGTYNITTPYMIYYGGIETNKNVENVIKSFAAVSDRFPDLKLVLIDKSFKLGWDNKVKPLTNKAQELYELCTDLKIRHRIVFTGEVHETHLPIILSQAKLMLHLSTYEGFGFAVLESLAAGTPLIASNRSCYPEVLGDAAILVDPMKPQEIAKQIESVLTNTKLTASLIESGIKKAATYNWGTTVEETVQAFTNIANMRRTLKVCYLIPYFHPMKGGAENNCLALAERVAALGADVTVLTSYRNDFSCPFNETYNGVKIRRFKRWNKQYYLGFYPKLLHAILATNADVIHVHGIGFFWQDFCVLIKKIFSPRTKFINTPHGPFMALNRYTLFNHILKFIYTPFLKLTLKLTYNTFIQVIPDQKKWMSGYGISEKKITYIPNGLGKELYETEAAAKEIKTKYNLERKFIISFVGRFEQYKGVQDILDAVSTLKNIIKNLHFVAIGPYGNYFENLVDKAHSLKIDTNVTFLVKPSNAIVRSILGVSSIYIFPSEWEAFGISTLEAMAKKNAVITTKTEGGKFLIEDGVNGILVDYGHSDQIAKAIETLHNDKDLLTKMQANNFKKSQEFSMEKIILDYQHLLYE